jgi:hypothetical protein
LNPMFQLHSFTLGVTALVKHMSDKSLVIYIFQ